uniref:response regulator transcription factor n=1 Tax=Altererythrobacter segetis TaxID=1104773 RepID=UPI00140D4D06|nr:LuxR C-terminal-related transcriptional regulator [Altererythrobacter segetis]
MNPSAGIVLVDSDPLRRNSVARFFYDNGRHVEPYEDLKELRAFWPEVGLVFLHDDEEALGSIFDLMLDRGCWLPVIVYAIDPRPSRIVDVIQMGAMDYLKWPMTDEDLSARLALLSARRTSFAELRRKATRSQKLVGALSGREREVLFGLARGATNKSIARDLQISPRTIEIHRSNMMCKLRVNHLGEAITIALYSGFASSASDEGSLDPFLLQP